MTVTTSAGRRIDVDEAVAAYFDGDDDTLLVEALAAMFANQAETIIVQLPLEMRRTLRQKLDAARAEVKAAATLDQQIAMAVRRDKRLAERSMQSGARRFETTRLQIVALPEVRRATSRERRPAGGRTTGAPAARTPGRPARPQSASSGDDDPSPPLGQRPRRWLRALLRRPT